MTTATKAKAQIHMEETILNNPELLEMLEEREAAKEGVRKYKSIDKEVKDKIGTLPGKPPFRLGRFVINISPTPPKSVSFETAGSKRISIKLLGDD